ncbi:MAG TPA: hypothetical protein VFW33_09210 [Gemmataceae bacterium]|nr:hypothetical protein [Gemmataceae bacterium]
MSFRVRHRPHFARQLRAWNLPVGVQIDVRLALDRLAQNPGELLRRVTEPFDGMTYTFPVVDSDNRVYGYVFTFHVRYGADEETLWVVKGGYERVAL